MKKSQLPNYRHKEAVSKKRKEKKKKEKHVHITPFSYRYIFNLSFQPLDFVCTYMCTMDILYTCLVWALFYVFCTVRGACAWARPILGALGDHIWVYILLLYCMHNCPCSACMTVLFFREGRSVSPSVKRPPPPPLSLYFGQEDPFPRELVLPSPLPPSPSHSPTS